MPSATTSQSHYEWFKGQPPKRMVYFTRRVSKAGPTITGYRYHHGAGVWSPPFKSHVEAKLRGPDLHSRMPSDEIEYGIRPRKKEMKITGSDHLDLVRRVQEFIGVHSTVEAIRASGVSPDPVLLLKQRELLNSLKQLSDYSIGC